MPTPTPAQRRLLEQLAVPGVLLGWQFRFGYHFHAVPIRDTGRTQTIRAKGLRPATVDACRNAGWLASRPGVAIRYRLTDAGRAACAA